jgi:hypothetical protein
LLAQLRDVLARRACAGTLLDWESRNAYTPGNGSAMVPSCGVSALSSATSLLTSTWPDWLDPTAASR